MIHLYDLALAYRQAAEQLDEGGVAAEALDAIEGQIQDKAKGLCVLIAEAKLEAEAYDAEIARLKEHRDRARNRAERIKEYLLQNMSAAGLPKLATGYHKVSVRQSPPSVRWTGSGLPPESVRVVTISYDARKVLELAKSGETPQGFEIVRGQHLHIV